MSHASLPPPIPFPVTPGIDDARLMRPVRWAGWLMIASGVLVALTSAGYFAYALLNRDGLVRQLEQQLAQAGTESALDLSTLVNLVLVLCGLGVLEGGLCAILGVMVCRRSRSAVITSISITALRGVIVVLCLLLLGIATLLPGFTWDASATLSVVLTLLMGAYLVWQLVLLILALRNLGRLRAVGAGGYGPAHAS